jgi:acetyl esterase/lipase
MQRRGFVISTLASMLPAAVLEEPQTYTYRKVQGHEIKADVYGASARGHKPVAVWIHGGALIMGSRWLPPTARILTSLSEVGFAVVSIDYRLAPETKLPGIIEDVVEAIRWIRSKGPDLGLDGERLVVCGGSAGGYLTLMTGFAVKPRPLALVSFWGYGDIVGPWYSRPDPFYLKQPEVTREEAESSVGHETVSEPPPNNNRGRFYLYCRQQGLWPKEVAGHDPATEDHWFDRYSPIRNVTRDYPRTLLVHGTTDTDVPYEQSKMMAARFQESGVEHELITVPEGGHGLGNISAETQDGIYRKAAAFLKR